MTDKDTFHTYYYTPYFTSALGGVGPLKKKLSKDKSRQIARNSAAWLQSQDPYTLHKPAKLRYERRKTIVSGAKEQVQADLIDVQKIKQENDGNGYILTMIDVFSKKAWAQPVQNKSGQSIAPVLRRLLNEYPVNYIQTDKGKEFANKAVQEVFESAGVRHFTSQDDRIKASIVERFNRTLRSSMYKWFTKTGSQRYLELLPGLVEAYNNRYHHSINMAPNEVNSTNQEDVWLALYSPTKFKKNKAKLQPGMHVRISKAREAFERGYTRNWTYEIFIVNTVNKTTPVTYSLVDLDAEPIQGSFYEEELQKVDKPNEFRVESVVKTKRQGKKLFHLIKWLGYPDKFNQWISDEQLRDLK